MIYNVIVWRVCTNEQTRQVQVTANSEEEAKQAALAQTETDDEFWYGVDEEPTDTDEPQARVESTRELAT